MNAADRVAPGVVAGQRLEFVFDGRRYVGLAGDTLASALLANGVSVVGRSFKLHRPRGIVAAGADEPNAIVQLEPDGAWSEPDLKATQVELYDGLVARSVNCWPNAHFDVAAVLGLFKRFLPAGFYYKTFFWPSWRVFEPAIRSAAGLGRAPRHSDPDRYATRHAHCDVLVVGAGPAGLTAAQHLADAGASVMVVDENPHVGASFMWQGTAGTSRGSIEWAARAERTLAAHPAVRVLRRTIASGYYDGNLVTLAEHVSEHLPLSGRSAAAKQRLWLVRARHVVVATGAHERPIVFGNNDRPGVMLSHAAATYAAYFGVLLGREAVGFTNNDGAYGAMFAAHDRGMPVRAIIDSRSDLPEAVAVKLRQECERRGIEWLLNSQVVDTRGRHRIARVEIRTGGSAKRTMACDTLLMSGGWSPVVHLYSQATGRLRYDAAAAMFRPDGKDIADVCTVIGSANGTFALEPAIDEARAAARTIAGRLGLAGTTDAASHDLAEITNDELRRADMGIEPLWSAAASTTPAWVDFQNDVTRQDVQLAARENFISVEHLKRYTTIGMASDQGKTSNVNALALLGQATGRAPDEVGTTRFRPPYSPLTIGAMAGHARGDKFAPRQYLAAHGLHLRLGAQMMEYGNWMRPAFYRQGAESDAAAWNREVLHVRQSVGVFDGSPLGKIEVRGADAAAFLNAVYANELATLAPGECRYAVMLNEGGGILDDGVITRLADTHFLVGTSSAGVLPVMEALEYWRESGEGYRVALAQASDQWATYAVTGPAARDVLRVCAPELDLRPASFPHMSFRHAHVLGRAARIARVSFSGEITFEVSVAACHGAEVLESLIEAGALPFGIEALMIMRIEKGYIHVGGDTEPGTTLSDVGMGAFGSRKSRPFVGQRAARRLAMTAPTRMQRVGIECVSAESPMRAGGHLVKAAGQPSEGYLTSCAWSPVLRRFIALAMLKAGTGRLGESILIYDNGKFTPARIVSPCFIDPDGEKLKQ
jgi:sarcosine oxidase subunit alpha